jgi:hypothetical protein
MPTRMRSFVPFVAGSVGELCQNRRAASVGVEAVLDVRIEGADCSHCRCTIDAMSG